MHRRANRGSCPVGILLVCLGLVQASSLPAQTTGRVEGTVLDPDNAPLAGATVEIAGPRLQGKRSTQTTTSGTYRLPSLPPGVYTVTVSLTGFGTVQKTAAVTLDGTATVSFQLEVAASAEVTVTGVAPLVDSTSPTSGSNYSAKIIAKLPIGRNYADVVFAQPGAQADFGETKGRSLPISIYGATSAENLFLIDGINTTNVVKGIEGKDINNEFVEEVEVKTDGYQAEYGRNTGGVINVITKSGGNEFHGGAFAYYYDTGMRASPENAKPESYDTPPYSETGDSSFFNYVLSKDVRQEYGVDLGGYLWKDRVWFFAAYDRVVFNQTVQALDPNFVDTFGREFPNEYVQNKWAGKLTLNPFASTTLVGSYFSDPQTQQGVIQQPPPTDLDPRSYGGRLDTGGPDYAARMSQILGSRGLFTVQYAKHSDRYATIPIGATAVGIRDHTVSGGGEAASLGGYGEVFGPIQNNHSTRESFDGAFTAFLGNMEVKLGGDYVKDSTAGLTYFTGRQLLHVRPCIQEEEGTSFCDLSKAPIYDNGQPPLLPDGSANPAFYHGPVFYQHDVLASDGNPDFEVVDSSPFDNSTKRYSVYVQDQWRITAGLTVNLGLRYDSETYYGRNPVGTYTAFNLTGQWAPRLGFAWDFAGDGTSKLFGSAGRFYYAIPTDVNVRAFGGQFQNSVYNYDPSSYAQDPSAPRDFLAQGGFFAEPVDPGIKESYQDELTLGIEKALSPTLSVALKGTYRSLRRSVEDRCDLDYNYGSGSTCGLTNPGGTGPVATGQYPLCDASGSPFDPQRGTCGLTGFPMGDARRIFRGVELVAREQFSGELWAQASLLYSSLTGTYSGAVREATGQTDPGINSDFDYYQFAQSSYGRLELDRPLQFRLDAAYSAPFGLWAGLSFYVRSGRPTNELGWFNDAYRKDLYLATRGNAGRLPTDYDMSVSLAYDWNIGPVTITPMLYVSNLLNRQTPNDVTQYFNAGASFVTNTDSPFYGQPGVEPGLGDCPASASAPCSDTPDYRKITQRISPRRLQVALRVTF